MPRQKTPAQDWLNRPAAHARLREIEQTLAALEVERHLLVSVLGGAATSGVPVNGVAKRRPGRPAGSSGPSLLDLIAGVMGKGPPGKSWVVGDLKDALAKTAPAKVAAANASALISSALIQAMRAKHPRFVGSGGGPGRARRYKLAAASA